MTARRLLSDAEKEERGVGLVRLQGCNGPMCFTELDQHETQKKPSTAMVCGGQISFRDGYGILTYVSVSTSLPPREKNQGKRFLAMNDSGTRQVVETNKHINCQCGDDIQDERSVRDETVADAENSGTEEIRCK